MARKDKSSFLSKLARFVANPTTDWAALDAAQAGQKGDASDGERQGLTRDEISALREKRRKDNHNIRVREFAILRRIRVDAAAANIRFGANDGRRLSGSSGTDAAQAKQALLRPMPTLITNFGEKIDSLERQMAEQWWDKSGSKESSLSSSLSMTKIAKTQMLIETRIGEDKALGASDADMIEFAPALLDSRPTEQTARAGVRPAVQSAASVPVQTSAPLHVKEKAAQILASSEAQAQHKQGQEPSAEDRRLTALHTGQMAVPAAGAAQAVLSEYPAVSLRDGVEEQVDFSSEKRDQSATDFVYRDAFANWAEDDAATVLAGHAEKKADGLPALLSGSDAALAVAVQADQGGLYSDSLFSRPFAVTPEYTPDDLPECLNEPAILFVQGKHDQAEVQLLELAQAEQLAARAMHSENEPHVSLALLDFYRCTRQEEKFETASIQMVRHFDRSAPQYQGVDLGEASRILSTLGASPEIDYAMQSDWCSPPELDLTDVMLLRAQLMTGPAQVILDWQALQVILDDAVEPLLDQFRDLAERKVDLLMWGSERLLACCVRKIKEQNGEPSPLLSLLWLLRLELERIMHGQEVFEQLALEYCMVLEESPPSWAPVRCRFINAENALSVLDASKEKGGGQLVAADVNRSSEAVSLWHPLQWKGVFQGDIQALLRAVSAECRSDFCTIDCSQFNGMDYPAAVALLEWLMEQRNAKRQIQFVQVNRLLAVFWRVMGITAQATVRLRRD